MADEEQLRREVFEQCRMHATWPPMSAIQQPKVRVSMDALRDHYQARPTFERIEGLVEPVARALAKADRIEICSDAIYAMSSYGPKAQAAIAAILAALKEVDHD